MINPLQRALGAADLSEDTVAADLGVDPKTVRRWLAGRLPYPRHRSRLAALLGRDERDLWPNITEDQPALEEPNSEILATYPHRWAAPRQAWQRLFASAKHEIGVLVYAGLFLAEDDGILRTFEERANEGVTVRILVGDPSSPCVAERGIDEGVEDALSAKIRNALVFYRPLTILDGIEIRLHQTILYTSIYRADDELLVNAHIYGVGASQAPVLHLRKVRNGDMASTYLDSFERVWAGASAFQ
jgi:hypothetical protein